MKKEYKGTEWSENRFSRFQIGLIMALIFVLYAFNYEGQRPIYDDIEVFEEQVYIEQHRRLTLKVPPVQRVVIQTENLPLDMQDLPVPNQDFQLISLDPMNHSEDPSQSNTYVQEQAAQFPLAPEDPVIVDEIIPSAPVVFAEQMPLFESCISEYEEYQDQLDCTTHQIMKIVRKHLRYPAVAMENGIEGTVVGSFVVDTFGVISNIKVERSAGFGLDEAVIKVFQKIPALVPAEQNQRKVKVKMHIPVKFRLSN